MAHDNGHLEPELLDRLGQIQGWVMFGLSTNSNTLAMPTGIEHDQVEISLKGLGNACPAESIIGQSVGKDQGWLCTAGPVIGQKTIGNIDPT
jgi:hypothetical protein